MRRILLVLFFLVFCGQYPLIYREKYIPDPIPIQLEGVYELDTLVSGYWEIRVGDAVVYPTMVGYKAQADMESYIDWPSVGECVEKSKMYFRDFHWRGVEAGEYEVYYEDEYVRVFVGKK